MGLRHVGRLVLQQPGRDLGAGEGAEVAPRAVEIGDRERRPGEVVMQLDVVLVEAQRLLVETDRGVEIPRLLAQIAAPA